jgi:hypothetical protein
MLDDGVERLGGEAEPLCVAHLGVA